MTIERVDPCPGDWCLTWGAKLDGDWHIQIECNGGDGGNSGDCGWVLVLDFDSSDAISSRDLREYEDAHDAHRAGLMGRA